MQKNSLAEPVVRALLERAAARLRLVCANLLHRSYPRLTRPPLNLQTDEMLSAVVERLLKAMREARPQTVRQFFALAGQHMRWELNDLARRLDRQPAAVELAGELVPAAGLSALDPQGANIQSNLAIALWRLNRHKEVNQRIRAAIRLNPRDGRLRITLGKILESDGNPEAALVEYREAVKLAPLHHAAHDELRKFLLRLRRPDNAIAAWQRAISVAPGDHEACYGYAELCLYLDKEDEYRSARRQLLADFCQTTNPQIAERVSRACLLMPATGDELHQAVALAKLAASVDPASHRGLYSHFLFARGLAEYRQGDPKGAIATLRGDAGHVLQPGPQLVLAMALYQQGKAAEAKKTLADAVLSHDWHASEVRDQDGWIVHALRREAERMIVPDWTDLAGGQREPTDNDERICLLAVCEFENRARSQARLYAAAVAGYLQRSEDAFAGHRYRAAAAAALAATGQGVDAADLPAKERNRLRSQARQRLRADLAFWKRAYAQDSQQARSWIKKTVSTMAR